MRRVGSALLAVVALLALAACTDDGPEPSRPEPAMPQTRDVDLGNGLLVLPNTAAAWVDAHPDDPIADEVRERIAEVPQAFWLVGNAGDANLPDAVRLAKEQDRTLQLVLYNIPGRDDGISGPQGLSGAEAYRQWIDRISAEIGDARAVVVVEPDALWFVDRQTPSGAAYDERMESLRYAATTLTTKNPNVRAYLEAGTTSGSVTPERMAELLDVVGLSDRIGFAVNVSSFAPSGDIVRYARTIRQTLIDDHGVKDPTWVVDTSRNGNPTWDFTWCNPEDREIGDEPGVVGSADGHDLDLWIKGPATSDGDCGAAPGSSGGDFLRAEAERMLAD